MGRFLIRRMFFGIIVLFGVITVTFILTRIVPSDPAASWVGPRATLEQMEMARIELGLDRPVTTQYFIYIRGLLNGDLGNSFRSNQPVLDEIVGFLPATLELVLLSTIIAVFVGVPLGILSAKHKGKWADHFCRLFSVGAVSLPTFWVGLFLQLIFFSGIGLLPLGGRMSVGMAFFHDIPNITGFLILDSLLVGNFELALDALRHIILPGITLSLYPIGLVARMTRSALLEILGEDYIAAARSCAVPERRVLWAYALKNSLGPTATVLTLSVGYTIVNTFLVEAIFSWPGIGMYISSAVVSLDYPAIMGVTILSTCVYVVLNMIADIIVALDPRVRV